MNLLRRLFIAIWEYISFEITPFAEPELEQRERKYPDMDFWEQNDYYGE